jgi:regulator of sirC expression with transglutaminase-like and TPR domain
MNRALTPNWSWLRAAAEADISLIDAALSLASEEYPSLDIAAYKQRIDDLAAALTQQLVADAEPLDKLRALNRFMFDELKFRGNFLEYQDPRNSYLNEVMDRRTGIPISLSVLYIELGRRIGMPLEGLAFPGHFLVRMPMEGGVLVLDPYHLGRAVGADELKHRLSAHGVGEEIDDQLLFQWLKPAHPRDIVIRMLRNLKAVYAEHADHERALRCADRLVQISDDPSEVRDRGLLYLSVGAIPAAKRDFEQFLLKEPSENEREPIEQMLRELIKPARLH